MAYIIDSKPNRWTFNVELSSTTVDVIEYVQVLFYRYVYTNTCTRKVTKTTGIFHHSSLYMCACVCVLTYIDIHFRQVFHMLIANSLRCCSLSLSLFFRFHPSNFKKEKDVLMENLWLFSFSLYFIDVIIKKKEESREEKKVLSAGQHTAYRQVNNRKNEILTLNYFIWSKLSRFCLN
jgi:hypothetical protein